MTSGAKTITCRGCGQVGAVAIDPKDGRLRRHGFYMHERGGVRMIACCKCQQIQPLDASAK